MTVVVAVVADAIGATSQLVTVPVNHPGRNFDVRRRFMSSPSTEYRSVQKRSAYVDVKRNRAGAISGATLYWAPDEEINTLTLCEELAYYLGTPDDAEALALLFSSRGDVLDKHHINDQDLALADAAVRRAGAAEDDVPLETTSDQEHDSNLDVGGGNGESAAEPTPSKAKSPGRPVASDRGRSHGSRAAQVRRRSILRLLESPFEPKTEH